MNQTQQTWLALLLAVTLGGFSARRSEAADLRTTLCDRPVCRTVAVTSEPVFEPAPTMSTETVFDDFATDYETGCDSACGRSCGRSASCGSGCIQCCFRRPEMWATADFLLGWRHSVRFPPLVTTSPNGTLQNVAGVLPGATTVYPTEPVGEEARPGARIAVGAWLDPCHCWGIEARYFMLADEVTTFTAASTGAPILARPFFDVPNNVQASRLLAFPGIATPGSVTIDTDSQLHGGDALFQRAMRRWECGELYLLFGYQFARLDESLLIRDSLTDVNPNNLIADGTTQAITDSFSTRNEYHAATIGSAMRWQRNDLRCEILAKLGLGNMHETVSIAGQTVVTTPGGAPAVNAFGLLAQGANLGTVTQDQFSLSPELNVKLSYAVTNCLDVSCGYTFLYFSNVVAPGEQIDVDLRVPADRFLVRDSEYWMHAFQCGASVRF